MILCLLKFVINIKLVCTAAITFPLYNGFKKSFAYFLQAGDADLTLGSFTATYSCLFVRFVRTSSRLRSPIPFRFRRNNKVNSTSNKKKGKRRRASNTCSVLLWVLVCLTKCDSVNRCDPLGSCYFLIFDRRALRAFTQGHIFFITVLCARAPPPGSCDLPLCGDDIYVIGGCYL